MEQEKRKVIEEKQRKIIKVVKVVNLENKKKILVIYILMESEKDLMMYYQTTLRNTGLFTTVSFAALGYSRYYRGKDKFFNISLIIASMIFMGITLMLSKFLIDDMEKWEQDIETPYNEKYLIIPKVIFGVNVFLLTLAVYTLMRELIK